ncbi:IclR family transcriptional regulator C-terminal domain-containing protein [Streptomyces sp. NPDC012794]|uniref:IclR family transcriptional regulator domain-containing protein n=1 Tax=Streptomyces sp. NPDC012794 TaxID=3364850 RepID=UPI00367E832C
MGRRDDRTGDRARERGRASVADRSGRTSVRPARVVHRGGLALPHRRGHREVLRTDLPDLADASAAGKSLLAQLDGAARVDHLTRYPAVRLTERTNTDPVALFESLDQGGPHGARISVLEYSRDVVCVAVPSASPTRSAALEAVVFPITGTSVRGSVGWTAAQATRAAGGRRCGAVLGGRRRRCR